MATDYLALWRASTLAEMKDCVERCAELSKQREALRQRRDELGPEIEQAVLDLARAQGAPGVEIVKGAEAYGEYQQRLRTARQKVEDSREELAAIESTLDRLDEEMVTAARQRDRKLHSISHATVTVCNEAASKAYEEYVLPEFDAWSLAWHALAQECGTTFSPDQESRAMLSHPRLDRRWASYVVFLEPEEYLRLLRARKEETP